MVRRVPFYSLCLVFGLSVMLILAARQYTDTCLPSYSERRINILDFIRKKVGAQQPFPFKPHHEENIERILEKTREKIESELLNYNFTVFTHSKTKNLQDLIPESGGQPIRSLVISTWRSGSTFIGDILNAMPGNFYHFEPFMDPEVMQIRGPPKAELALKSVKALYKCDFGYFLDQYLEDYLSGKANLAYQFSHNTRFWEHVKYSRELFFDAIFTSRFCKLFPFQSMKLVRFRLRLVHEVLEDHALNVKVVLLVRDPRAVMGSRQRTGRRFCQTAPDCCQAEMLCADMISDYIASRRLQRQYPDRLMVLRFEDLALEPQTTVLRLFTFLGLSMTPAVQHFLDQHTKLKVGGEFTTYRETRDVPFKWKQELKYDFVEEVQVACKQAMDLWGYRLAQNATHMASKDFYPLEKQHISINYITK